MQPMSKNRTTGNEIFSFSKELRQFCKYTRVMEKKFEQLLELCGPNVVERIQISEKEVIVNQFP